MSASRIRVASADELLEGVPIRVTAFGQNIALVRWRGVARALSDICPHRGAPMHRGEVVNGCLECPLHGWAFSLETGLMPNDPALSLEVFDVLEAEDGGIYLLSSGA